MRQFPRRPKLLKATKEKLASEASNVAAALDPKAEAERRFDNARKTKWFQPVVNALKKIAGTGGRCMYCSGSESSDVEHYKPKSTFPQFTFTWENYLWTCSICNRAKLNQFPVETNGSNTLVNPVDENIWNYFYIDQFGNLTPTWDVNINDYNSRGKETARIIGLDRQALQETRQSRMDDLKEKVRETIKSLKEGKITALAARRRIAKWRKQPFQPDVADYFLNGPGREEAPFKALFKLI